MTTLPRPAQKPLPYTTVATLVCALSAGALHAASERVVSESVTLTARQNVSIEFPVGTLTVLPSPSDELEATLDIRCRRGDCGSLLDRVRLEIEADDREVHVEVDGYPRFWGKSKLEIHATFRVPAGREIEVEMGVGDLVVEGVADDLAIELGVGDLDLRLPEAALRSVTAEAGVGDASIRGAAGDGVVERHFVGASAEWHAGVGDAVVSAEVGVGDVDVRLTADG